MPDDPRNDDGSADGDGETYDVRQLRQHTRELERQLKELKPLADAGKEAATLRRELAFRDAGIDPKQPGASYFMKGYDGELTAEAILAEAKAAGFVRDAQSTQGQDPQARNAALDSEATRLARMDRVSSGRNPDQDAEFESAMATWHAKKGSEAELDQILIRYGRMTEDHVVDDGWGRLDTR